MSAVIFSLLAIMTVVPALFVVTVKNVFHAALWLIVSLLGVAGLYAFMAADFLFAVQVLVYAGGVMVVLLFVILLSGRPSDWAGRQSNDTSWGAALFSVFFVVALSSALTTWAISPVEFKPQPTTGPLGLLLLNEMVLPFEVISIVFVAALIGAIHFSTRKPS